MNIRLNTSPVCSPVCLAKRQGVTLTEAKGTEIRCRRGGLWITQDGDPRDIVLQAGENFTVDRGGSAIVWALSQSTMEVVPARRPAPFAHAAGRQILQRLASWSQPGHVPNAS